MMVLISMLKKSFAAIASIGSLGAAAVAFAQTPGVDIKINTPNQGINPGTPVGVILSNALTIVFVLAALAVLFMLIIGGFQWITSGGDKEKVGKARERITQALIGLAVLALAYFITVVVGQLVNINVLNLKRLPSLGQFCNTNEIYNPDTGVCVAAPTLVPQRN